MSAAWTPVMWTAEVNGLRLSVVDYSSMEGRGATWHVLVHGRVLDNGVEVTPEKARLEAERAVAKLGHAAAVSP